MKIPSSLCCLAAFAAVLTASHAQVVVVTNASIRGSTNYAAPWFSGLNLLAGDYLVVAHANNKNANTNNQISASLTGSSDIFSSLNSGLTGTQSGAWIFYAPISSNASSVSITLSTSSASNNVSMVSTYWILRPSSGETLSVASTAVSAVPSTNTATSTLLDFNFTNAFTSGFGMVAVAAQLTNISSVVGSSAWTTNLLSSGTAFRGNFSLGSYSNSLTDPTVTMAAASDIAAVGLVVQSVPEPGTVALLSFGLAALFAAHRWRRN